MDNKKEVLTTLVSCPGCGGKGTQRVVDGASVRVRRENRGKSLTSVAHEMVFTATYLSDVELGRRQPDPEPFLTLFLVALEKADGDRRRKGGPR